MRPSAFRTALLLAMLAVPAASAAAEAGRAEPAALRKLVRPGEKAPAFTLEDLDGRAVSVAPGDGKVHLIVFFSAFCPLCRELAPSIRAIAVRSAGTIRVVGVNLDGRRFLAAVRSFVAGCGFGFPVLLDTIRDDLFMASDPYGVDKTPTAVVVDGRGFVRGAYAAEGMRDLVRDFDRIVDGLERN